MPTAFFKFVGSIENTERKPQNTLNQNTMSELALQLIAENKKTKNPFLDLENCGLINYLPEELLDCVWLEELKLSHNEITDFRSLEKLPNLINLELRFNNITDINFLENLTQLTYLDISFNYISDIRFLKGLKSLRQLNLSLNHIKNIQVLSKLSNLVTLYLSNNQITSIRSLEKLTNLEELDLSNNNIKDFSFLSKLLKINNLYLAGAQFLDIRFLEKLINLKVLDLGYNTNIDLFILSKFQNLISLNLCCNQIANISFLEKLTNLVTLELSENQITDISCLEKLTNLATLELNENQITDISCLEKLTNLTNLHLGSNQITDISCLEKLTNLTNLHLSSNQIINYSFLEKLTNLSHLYLGSNQILHCSFLGKLTNLTTLYLHSNQISDISFLEKLTNLNNLYLGNNQITDFSFFESLTNLTTLNLRSNQISDLYFIRKLTNLSQLDIGDNQISDITPILPLIQKGISISLEKHEWSEAVQLYNNPITTPPMHIVEQGNEAILRYFSAGKLWPLNECKLIFVGDGGVGKTCLMKRIVENTFDDKEKQTHGINKVAWENISNKNGERVKVNLWDFGGQDIQHSLHQFFFTERVIYILVLNPRNDEKAAYWLEQIEKLGADSEVLVVYNWKDAKDLEAPYMSNFYELRKKYNKLNNPFELSVKTGKGVDNFRESLKEAILRNEGLVQQYPEKWFNIKQKLEENVSVGENYIKYELYEKWCNDFDYTDEFDQKALLVTLDKIGSIVFFDKPILNSLQVLNPEWITTGAYAILTSELTKLKKGHLTNRDLKKIFSKEIEIFSNTEVKIKYKEGQFLYIIELMSSYDLCQENPFKKHEYLIPSAFGAKPNNNYDEHKKDARQYRIQFDSPFEMLIIHRFIAKNLSKVQGEDYWQSGIFIKDNSSDTFALVETNLHSSRIDFWIKGDNIRGFWEAMRRDFHDIFSIYKKFSYQEEVLYKHENGEVFLPYHEMLDSLKNNVFNIPYHPSYQLKDINVLAVLDLFEDAKATEITIRKEMEQKGNTYNFYGKVENSQVGGKGNTQTIINNADSSKSDDFNEIKKILLELQEANVNNELWKSTLLKCLDEFTKLEEVEDASAQKGIVDTSFSFLKNVKDFIDVSLLPVAVVEGFPKLLSLWDSFKSNL